MPSKGLLGYQEASISSGMATLKPRADENAPIERQKPAGKAQAAQGRGANRKSGPASCSSLQSLHDVKREVESFSIYEAQKL